MYSIQNNSTYLYEIKKSKFYTLLYKVDTNTDINKYLEQAKNNYKDATHYCYAYICDNVKRFNDDGEPSGTAGMPILEILEKKNLNNVLCIIVRYFGGIKLGAGGLIRAYSNATKEAILDNQIIELIEGYEIEIETDYTKKKEIDYLFKDNIIKEEYNDTVKITLKVKKEDLEKLTKYNYTIIKETLIEKE